ncbi:MAG: trypsin-like serine protease [Pseudomonadota bacterium]
MIARMRAPHRLVSLCLAFLALTLASCSSGGSALDRRDGAEQSTSESSRVYRGDRNFVQNASAVGLFLAQDENGDILHSCTAFLIAPSWILTNHHCAFLDEQPVAGAIFRAGDIAVEADLDSDAPYKMEEFPAQLSADGSGIAIPYSDWDADYAVIALRDRPGIRDRYGVLQPNRRGIGANTGVQDDNTPIEIIHTPPLDDVGKPIDPEDCADFWNCAQRVSRKGCSTILLENRTHNRINHTCSTQPGSSGAPVMRNGYVTAMHVGDSARYETNFGYAVPIEELPVEIWQPARLSYTCALTYGFDLCRYVPISLAVNRDEFRSFPAFRQSFNPGNCYYFAQVPDDLNSTLDRVTCQIPLRMSKLDGYEGPEQFLASLDAEVMAALTGSGYERAGRSSVLLTNIDHELLLDEQTSRPQPNNTVQAYYAGNQILLVTVAEDCAKDMLHLSITGGLRGHIEQGSWVDIELRNWGEAVQRETNCQEQVDRPFKSADLYESLDQGIYDILSED